MFNTRMHPEEIAEKFICMNCATEEERADIEEALYQLHAICENEYNHDFYRVLYKALEELAGTRFEIRSVYYDNDKPHAPNGHKQYFNGESINEVFDKYATAGEIHDLSKYTARRITSVESYKTL